jgi:hypothetical protein
MDGRFRRHFKGTPKHVKIGYGSNSKTRFLMPDGFYKFRVSNVKEVELLLMHNKKYAAGKFPFLPVPPFPPIPPSSRSTFTPFRQLPLAVRYSAQPCSAPTSSHAGVLATSALLRRFTLKGQEGGGGVGRGVDGDESRCDA